MGASNGVILLTEDTTVTDQIIGALQHNGHVLEQSVTDLDQLSNTLEDDPGLIALVDVDPEPKRLLARIEKITPRFPQTRFVFLSKSLDQDFLISAMEVGARHVLGKPSIEGELSKVLDRLTALGGGGYSDAILLLSASGGCGASFLGINIAHELAEKRGEPSLLVDLDCQYGGLGPLLGLERSYGVGDLMLQDRFVDPELVRTTAEIYSDYTHVLASPAATDFANPTPIKEDRLLEIVEACKRAYRQTILDAPRLAMQHAIALSELVSKIVLVFQPNVKDVRIAETILTTLIEKEVPHEKFVTIVNRTAGKYQNVQLSDIRRVLKDIPALTVRNDYRSAIVGTDLGQPLAKAAPRSHARRDIQKLLSAVTITASS